MGHSLVFSQELGLEGSEAKAGAGLNQSLGL
jgi:hypothetical protein